MTAELAVAIVGVIVAIIFGILGLRRLTLRRNHQKQIVKNGSGIQAGRDVTIGRDGRR